MENVGVSTENEWNLGDSAGSCHQTDLMRFLSFIVNIF